MSVMHIRQEDSHGCLVACLAMVTGMAYGDVRQWFVARGKVFESNSGGITEIDVEQFLGEFRFVYAKKYKWVGANQQRPIWPCEPFAPLHIVGVSGAGRHGVVLTREGQVLDPEVKDTRKLSDYQEVAYVIGVWPMPCGDSSSQSVQPRKKGIYIGAPACFALELALRPVCEAFNAFAGHGGCYIVGSCLQREDWRDVDVRMLLDDEAFATLFPTAGEHWEHDARWLILTVSISDHLSKVTGLPVDFQFQPRSHANARHSGPRSAIGLVFQTSPGGAR